MSQSKPKGKRRQTRRSPLAVVLALGGLLLVAAVIAASLLSGSSQQGETTGPGSPSLSITDIERSPDAQVEGLKVDFGEMKLGAEVATVRLTLRNTGAKMLQFSQPPYVQLADGC